ncbi:hypothetical protein ACFVYE_34470 [Streptomyces sp. NPDC058239]|uniref:hypothetical protein n=1 Tax=Streptomyces sp. NPDC058239 TaxID=3346395 RepID=UPI0036E26BA0
MMGPTPTPTIYDGAEAVLSGYGQVTTQHDLGREWLDDMVSWYCVSCIPPAALGRQTAAVRAGRRVAVEVAAWAGLVVAAAAVAVQAVVDLLVGFVAADEQAMSDMSGRVQDVPGVLPLVYTVVPMLFWVGLLGLVTLLAVFRRDLVRAWAPVAVLAGTALMAMSLDLLPVGALCIGSALFPVRRGLPD